MRVEMTKICSVVKRVHTDESVQWGSTRAVRYSDGSRELNEVTSGHVAVLLERLDEGNDLIETLVRVELRLGIGELDDGAVSTSTAIVMCQHTLELVGYVKHVPKLALRLKSGRERDGIVEGKTERIVSNVVALTTVEEVLLEVVTDGEEAAACLIHGAVDTVGAQSALGAWGHSRSLRGRISIRCFR